ncbi:uncharacterized protein LOC110449610 [Mizuhopecten yessoensis]|uniref:DED domain-containing protein n=1 Tax=Mizuhopecten yessoensis TaxID=6573 RepID=A0A210QQT1_MIZYE|nr:uncharacterized protein LOC110449610 [Mizuhopecten yessoensis]OWF51106.1 hypothetical protein KP79_PYT16629 [Mizuhopecten yessoensis]
MPKVKGHSSGKARVKPYEKNDKKEPGTDRECTEDNQLETKIKNDYQPNEETKMDMADSSLISPQWKFNKTLDDIAESLTEKDLPRMKFYCTAGCFGRKALKEADSPLMFFQLLMDMDFLSCNNLLHLQAMLWHIGRKDLHKQMVMFARECRRQPLYFFSPKSKPVNGFKHVKFHIGGSETNRREVENLGSVVAKLLCVRHEDVALVGFQPSNSIVITFMLPEEAIETLHDLVPEDRSVLKSMKVDYIFVGEQEIPLIGERMEKPTTISQIAAISKLLADEEYSRTKVERLQSLLLKRNEELRLAKSNEKSMQQGRDQAVLAFLTLMNNQRQSATIDSLVSKSCMAYFQHSLQTFRSKFPDEMDTIEMLLEAKELLACKAERDAWRLHEESMRLLNQLETNALRIQHSIDITSLQGIRYNRKPPRLNIDGNGTQQNATIQVSVKMVTQQVQTGDMSTDMSIVQAENAHHNKVTKALEEISKMLKPAQRKSLLRHSGINERDERVSKNSNEQFMLNLYRLQSPKQENNELEFAFELVRQLDDKTLNEKMYNIEVDLAKYHNAQHAMLQ